MQPLALLVDDEPYMCQFLARLLNRRGIASCEAQTNDEALALVQTRHPDLITTDLRRPGGTGLEFIQRVRAMPGLGAVPIILISGSTKPDERRQAEQAGVLAILDKPFEPEEFYAVIERVWPLDQPPT
jgi:two-component system chemotaxis response regulator CheY